MPTTEYFSSSAGSEAWLLKLETMRLNLHGPQEGKFIDLPKELPAGLRLASGDTALFRVQVLANGSIMLRPLQAAPAPPCA